jgi:TetR/AcrR family transcriptional repressor of nem operon
MKISREQVAENRRNILYAASKLFRERGFQDVTVAEIMSAAGLTHGAFYSYFSSKEDLIAHACEHVLSGEGAARPIPSDLSDFAKYYLSDAHRKDRSGGCLFAALGTDAARSSDETRDVITQVVRDQVAKFSETAPGRNASERRRAAVGSWAAMIGAVMLARAVNDGALAKELTSLTLNWLEHKKV